MSDALLRIDDLHITFQTSQGRLLAEGSVSDIEQNEEVRVAYLGSGGISGA